VNAEIPNTSDTNICKGCTIIPYRREYTNVLEWKNGHDFYHEAESRASADRSEGTSKAEQRETHFELAFGEQAQQIAPFIREIGQGDIMENESARRDGHEHAEARENLKRYAIAEGKRMHSQCIYTNAHHDQPLQQGRSMQILVEEVTSLQHTNVHK